MSARRGAERHAKSIVCIVVIGTAAVVNIIEIVIIVSRAEPPIRGGRLIDSA